MTQDQLPNPRGQLQAQTVALATQDGLTVIDGGPAKCKAIDRIHYEMFENRFGRGSIRKRGSATSVMEADWLATPSGLAYVTPALGLWTMWRWAEVTLDRRPTTWRFAKIIVNGPDGTCSIGMGRLAAENLLAIASARTGDGQR